MSQNIKHIKYTVVSNQKGQKKEVRFSDLEIVALVKYVKEQIYTFDEVVRVRQEITTYNIHKTKTVNLLKSQKPPKVRKMRVYNGLYYNSIDFTQFCQILGYSSGR